MTTIDYAPHVSVDEEDQSTYISGASTSKGGMALVTERGPVTGPPVWTTNWPAFNTTFGNLLAGYVGTYAAKVALDGGCGLYVRRITALDINGLSTAVESTCTLQTLGGGATKARETGDVAGRLWGGARTWQMANGEVVAFKVDGGGKVTATIAATAASKSLANQATFTLQAGWTIKYRVGAATEPERTVTLAAPDYVDIANATPAEVRAVLARDMRSVNLTLVGNVNTITTDQVGSGARLEFTGGTALAALGLQAEVLTGTGNVVDQDHITVAEMDALVTAADSGATFGVDGSFMPYLERTVAGLTKTIQVVTSNGNETAGAARFGFSTTLRAGTSNAAVDTILLTASSPGTWGDAVTIDRLPATQNPLTRFRLRAWYRGVRIVDEDELLTGTANAADERHVERVFTATHPWLRATDLDPNVTDQRPGGSGAGNAAVPQALGLTFSGGDDGLAGLADADYLGDATLKTGLHAFDTISDVSFLAAPGQTSRTFAAEQYAYCAARKDCLAVIDVPRGLTPAQIVDWRQATGAYVGGSRLVSTYAAAYENWPEIPDPLVKGGYKYVPPSGFVFAVLARTDAVSVWRAPAGKERGVLDWAAIRSLYAERSLEDVSQIYEQGVNSIIIHPQFGAVIWGEKTLAAVQSALDRVNVRRGLLFVRASILPQAEALGLFEPADAITWRRLDRAVDQFLQSPVNARGIAQAKFVCDETTNTAPVREANGLEAIFWIKPVKTAEFIKIRLVTVGQDVDLEPTA